MSRSGAERREACRVERAEEGGAEVTEKTDQHGDTESRSTNGIENFKRFSLRAFSVSPFLRVDPFPPQPPLTHTVIDSRRLRVGDRRDRGPDFELDVAF